MFMIAKRVLFMEKYNFSIFGDTENDLVLPKEEENNEIVSNIINQWFDLMKDKDVIIDEIPKGNAIRTLVTVLDQYDIKRKV